MKAIASIFALGSALVVASTVFAAEPSSQPLTRADCDKAGMGWDEGANVCVPNAEGSKAAGSKAQTAPKAEAASKEKNASKPKAALKAATPPGEKHVYKKKNKHAASKKRRTPPAKPKKDPSMLGRLTTNTRNSISRSNAAPSGGYFASQTDHQERPKSLSVGTFASEVGENRSQCAVNCKAAIESPAPPATVCSPIPPVQLTA
jgi:hypothetical protein